METNIHTTTWNFRLLKKLLSQNLVVLVKLIVDGNWIYSFENISSSMFLAHCDTLKKYEHTLHCCGVLSDCCGIWSLAVIALFSFMNFVRELTKQSDSVPSFLIKSVICSFKANQIFSERFTNYISIYRVYSYTLSGPVSVLKVTFFLQANLFLLFWEIF